MLNQHLNEVITRVHLENLTGLTQLWKSYLVFFMFSFLDKHAKLITITIFHQTLSMFFLRNDFDLVLCEKDEN